MHKVVVSSPPQRAVGVIEIAARVDAGCWKSVRLVEFKPVSRLSLGWARHISAFAPQPAIAVEFNGIAPGYPLGSTVLAHTDLARRVGPNEPDRRRAHVRVPDIPIRQWRQRPTIVNEQAVPGRNLAPPAIFVPHNCPAVVARPKFSGIWLVLDSENVCRRVSLKRMVLQP